MDIPIRFLNNVLILCAVLFPTALGANIGILFQRYKYKSLFHSLLGMLTAYILLLTLLFVDRRELLKTNYNFSIWYLLIAVFGAVLCYGLELLVGLLLFYLRNRRLPKKIVAHKSYAVYRKVNALDYVAVALFVIFEEFILRVVLYNVLQELYILPTVLMIFILSLVYALNHLTFGVDSVIQKLFSGIALICLFIYTGFNISYPIVAHAIYNISLLILSRRRVTDGT